tara:strand:- start:56 stop:766 length:711 start_codon:yes stop_codon:yes gene_type:complete
MSNEQAYIEVEQEWIGDWPGPRPEKNGPRQYYDLAEKLKKDVRSRSIAEGITPSDYWKIVVDAKEVFDDLRYWMNYSDHMTEKQLEKFSSQRYWLHMSSYEGGLTHLKQDVWPINRDELIGSTRKYLESPFMWSESLDYLLTDALIYAETSGFRQSIVKDGLLNVFIGSVGAFSLNLLRSLVKWIIVLGTLAVSHEVSPELFLALSISVIAYQLSKSISGTPKSKVAKLYTEMVGV